MSGASLRERATYLAKWGVASVVHATGMLQAWSSYGLRGRAVVLMYHRVLSGPAWARSWSHPGMIVGRDTFERQVAFLKRRFRVLTLAEFESHLRDGTPFPPRSCLITFDDGWVDTYTDAWPVLQKYGVPAVVFLPTDYVGTGRAFWREELRRLLFEAWTRAGADEAFAARARAVLAGQGFADVLAASPSDARDEIMRAVQSRKYDEDASSAAAVEALRTLLPEAGADPVDAFVTWDQVREMSRDGITFGAHSATHRLLTRLAEGDLRAEVVAPRRVIERELGRPVTAFCYPNGNWNAAVAATVREGGYEVAFSTEPGTVGVDANRLALRRVNVHDDLTKREAMFFARMVGLL